MSQGVLPLNGALHESISPGSRPLRGTKEAYAHARACFHNPTEAARIAGFSHRSGQSSKWERNRKVQERIAYLSREPEATTRAERKEIKETYYGWFRNPKLRIPLRLEVSKEIRKMGGLDAPTKIAPTTPDGTEPYSGGLEHLTDEQLAKLEEANAILAGAAGAGQDTSGA